MSDTVARVESLERRLRELEARLSRVETEPVWLTVAQVAVRTGMSERSVEYARDQALLVAFPVPTAGPSATGAKRRWRYHTAHVDAWLAGTHPRPIEELLGQPKARRSTVAAGRLA